jgi:hypothetical protein
MRDVIQKSLFNEESSNCDERKPVLVNEVNFKQVQIFPAFEKITNGELFEISLKNDTSPLTHGLHRFPAKFIPQIPRWAMEQFALDSSIVLDPFMGSGTTLVEGLLRNGTTIGIDIDPLARLIAYGKINTPSLERLICIGEQIRSSWSISTGLLVSPMPDIENFNHWFSEDAWRKLQSLWKIIKDFNVTESERKFLLVLFSSILRWVSNADDQSQKTYVSGTNKKTPPETMKTFWRSFEKAIKGINQLSKLRKSEAYVFINDNADACSFKLPSKSIDLIVTSPPYLDSVDYLYNLMLEYFWLGQVLDVPDRTTFNKYRRLGIGAKQPLSKHPNLPPALKDLIHLEELPASRQQATITYFQQMENHFNEASRCLKENARYVLVIGNSQTTNNIVPIHDCLVRLAATSGLNLEKAFAYRIRRHYMKFPRKGRGGIILVDWIIVLKKDSKINLSSERLPLHWLKLGEREVAH